MIPFFESALKSSVIAALGLVAVALLRRQTAALRHFVLAMTITASTVVPLLQVVTPAWELPQTWAWSRPLAQAAMPLMQGARGGAIGPAARTTPPAQSPERAAGLSPATIAGAVWMTGTAVMLLVLAAGLVRLTRMTRRAGRIQRGAWFEIGGELTARLGLRRRTTIRLSEEPAVLAAWGGFRPNIVLPASSPTWSAARIRVVLAHELAHIARHDWPLLMLGELLRAVYWFNPLVWVVTKRLRAESERACDDAVLASGVDGPDYAEHLLGIASELRHRRNDWLPAPAMARASHLEGRIAAMLNPALNRAPMSPSRRIVSLLTAAAVALAVSGYAISAQTFASLAGSVNDQLGGLVPGATLVLTNAQSGAKYEVKSNSVGVFEFVGLPAGEYALATHVPGFKTLESTIVIGGQTMRRDLALELGTLQETVTVAGRRNSDAGGLAKAPAVSGLDVIAQRRPEAEARAVRTVAACAPSALGGAIKVPMKTRDVRPDYPEAAQRAGLEGAVDIAAVIGPNGQMSLVRVTRAPDPSLSAAALEAVMQWEFTPTLLNCRAVEVQMSVRVRFVLEP